MGLSYDRFTNWSEEEDILLSTYYPIGGYKLCVAKGLDRSRNAVNTRTSRLGLKYIKKADRL